MAIIFIAGLARSGTTFLQSCLLEYDNVVALGEVSQTIEAIKNSSKQKANWKIKARLDFESYWNPKTYHVLLERVANDSFWSSIQDDIKQTENIETAIELVYDKALQKYPNHTIIDSSKHIDKLQNAMLVEKYRNDIKVVLCIRDYRGWLYSVRKHQTNINRQQRNQLVEIYKWLYSNKKFLKYLSSNLKGNFQVLSYDKLVFSYDKTLIRTAGFCGLNNKSAGDNKEKFHEILGSPSFKESSADNNFQYDISWFSYVNSGFDLPVSLFNKKIYLDYSL